MSNHYFNVLEKYTVYYTFILLNVDLKSGQQSEKKRFVLMCLLDMRLKGIDITINEIEKKEE